MENTAPKYPIITPQTPQEDAAGRAVLTLVRDRQRLPNDNAELRARLQAALHRIYCLEMGED